MGITHAVRRNRNRDRECKELNNKLNKLQNQQNPDKDIITEMQNRVKEVENRKTEGVKIRSRVTWLEEGEKPKKILLWSQKKKARQHTDYKAPDRQGQGDYWRWNPDRTERVLSANFHTWTWWQGMTKRATRSNGQSTQQGYESLLQRTGNEGRNGGCPKKDAYKQVSLTWRPWPQSSTTLSGVNLSMISWNSITSTSSRWKWHHHNENRYCDTSTRKKECKLLKSWHPISLLNSDYKLLATVLANCVRVTTAPSIKLHLSKSSNMILISLNQEKAFDRVNRDFLFRILERLNYGPTFIQWLKMLYNGANCKIIDYGWRSDSISLECCIWRECPLLPLLCTLVIRHWLTQYGNIQE